LAKTSGGHACCRGTPPPKDFNAIDVTLSSGKFIVTMEHPIIAYLPVRFASATKNNEGGRGEGG
jgi:hypothetical protein